MGKDIHMHIIGANGEVKLKEIFEGRNSYWFDDICGRGRKDFESLPIVDGYPKEYKNHVDGVEIPGDDNSLFDFYYMKVEDFIEWYYKVKPYLCAGWFSRYDAWLIKNDKMKPNEDDVFRYPSKEEVDNEMLEFIEYNSDNNFASWIVNEVLNTTPEINANDYIYFYFDW